MNIIEVDCMIVMDIDLPKSCLDCPCINKDAGYCQADKLHRPIVDDTNDYNPKTKPKWCPIKLLK